jgi:hypothetical protein
MDHASKLDMSEANAGNAGCRYSSCFYGHPMTAAVLHLQPSAHLNLDNMRGDWLAYSRGHETIHDDTSEDEVFSWLLACQHRSEYSK